MVDMLKKSLAPVSAAAWEEIEETAAEIFKGSLTGRKLVDTDGPHGWELGAVNLGRVNIPDKHEVGGVSWGMREVQPLMEVRVPFSLDLMEIDSIDRGAADADLEPLETAAVKLVEFEENAIYRGFSKASIKGTTKAADHKPLTLPANCEELPGVVANGIKLLRDKGIGGPYALVLGADTYHCLIGSIKGYPLYQVVNGMAEGGIYSSLPLQGGMLISVRGGDFQLTLGRDIAIGYTAHDRDKVELYFTESFTFRVIEPAAAVELKV